MSENLLCSFELLKPLDGAALRKETTKAKRKRCVLVSLCPLVLCLHMSNSILTALDTVETRAGEVHPQSPFLEGDPPKKGVNLTAVTRRRDFFSPLFKAVKDKKK